MRTVIIGSGIAGITFAEELRKLEPEAEILVLTHENRGYYSRPMLSHGFSRSDVETKIILKSFDELRRAGIDVRAPFEATAIDRSARLVRGRGERGETAEAYSRLILAPGSDALIPGALRAAAGLFRVLNSLDDLLALRQQRARLLAAGQTPRWAIVGGGLIGCEVASDLAVAGDRVVLFHALPRLMERQLVEADSATLLEVLESHGIDVRLSATVTGFRQAEDGLAVALETGLEAGFHGVLVACGFRPRTELAEAAGLAVGRGIKVDAGLRTADPDIFAIGDAAECADGRIYAYVMPIRHQAQWLARWLAGQAEGPWQAPIFRPRAKVHGFTAAHPYLF